jgi:hypothetical protein
MMKGRNFKGVILLSCLFISGWTVALGSDLDDGISKYTDDGISKYDDLGKADRNINFTVLDAKSRAQVRANAGEAEGGGTSDKKSANMNSVIMGPGGTVRGDIIIIDQSKGDKTQVVE